MVVAIIELSSSNRGTTSTRQLSPFQARLVALAESEVGYKTDPPDSYCNRFSAYWHAGTADCGNDNRSEEWCADFAAWVWKQAGAGVLYELAPNFLTP